MSTCVTSTHVNANAVSFRDCAGPNIMMDGGPLYPKGFHPSWQNLEADLRRHARPILRRDARSLKYYFIDFGISSVFDDPNEPRLVTGMFGIDDDIPELSWSNPYNPFLVDICILGHVYKKHFINVSVCHSEYLTAASNMLLRNIIMWSF